MGPQDGLVKKPLRQDRDDDDLDDELLLYHTAHDAEHLGLQQLKGAHHDA